MIVLVGFMGAGKTTVGRALAARLGLPFVDSDQAIERSLGLSIPDIFEGYGEAGFRDIEARTIAALLEGPDAVIALGGGAVTTPQTREALRGHTVVHLAISLEDALARVGGDAGRPVLRSPNLAAIFEARADLYQEVATLTVSAARPARQVAREIVARLRDLGVQAVDRGDQEAGE